MPRAKTTTKGRTKKTQKHVQNLITNPGGKPVPISEVRGIKRGVSRSVTSAKRVSSAPAKTAKTTNTATRTPRTTTTATKTRTLNKAIKKKKV